MDIEKAIALRRSVRKYLDIPVEMEKVGNILDAGRFAPSAGNIQPWRFVLITDPDCRQKIAEACVQQYWMARAPLHIVVAVESHKSKRMYQERGEKRYALFDGAAAVQNMLLVATAQGLGSCWVAAFDDEMLSKATGVPESVMIVGVLTMGYSDENPVMPLRYSLEDVTFINEWGSCKKDFASWYGYTSHHVQNLLKKGKGMLEKVKEKVQDIK
ncbi:MAG: nitroreductase family protein [Candidatus Woesearchaeota archaeon]|nr:nitroreductase family protein [Candidatus Woesearchaeota archaeon]